MYDKHLVQDILGWGVGTWKQAQPFWERCAGDLTGAKVPDIGGRHGGLSLCLALRGCRVVCSDLKGLTEEAVALHRRYDVSQQVCYRQTDATMIDCPADEFDVVAFKSVMGGTGRNDDVEHTR